MAVTAISNTSPVASRYGVAFWVLAWGLASAIAFGFVLWLYPACNRTAAMPLTEAQRRPSDARQLSRMRSAVMARAGAGAADGGSKALE